MEQKRPVKTVPSEGLARVQLKRVAVAVRRDAPAAPAAPLIRRRVLLAEEDKDVRVAVMKVLPAERFEITGFRDGDGAYDHYQQSGTDLAILAKELPGTPGTVLCELIRKSRKGGGVAIVLMSPSYRDRYLGAGDCTAFGADAFFPLPATPDLLIERVELAISRREPVERLDVLPKEVARRVDELYETYDDTSYYDLLGVPSDAERAAIQQAFHQQSLVLHPDRHARLKKSHPHAWEKVNTVYKRISEAYKVLVDEERRRRYNLGLRKRGALRLEKDQKSAREERELALCRTEEARRHVLESLELRSLGDLEGGGECMARAIAAEPDNEALRLIHASIEKLVALTRR